MIRKRPVLEQQNRTHFDKWSVYNQYNYADLMLNSDQEIVYITAL